MSVDHFLPCPNSLLEVFNALKDKAGIVERVNDPTFSGRVMVKVYDMWGNTRSNWLSVASGAGNGPSGPHTGMSAPLRPGQSVIVKNFAGNPDKSYCTPGPPWLTEEGNPGSKVS